MSLSTVFTLWSNWRSGRSRILHAETTSPLLRLCPHVTVPGSETSTDWFLLLFSIAGSATHPLKVERAAAHAVVHQSLFAAEHQQGFGKLDGTAGSTRAHECSCAYLAEFFTVAWPVKTRTNTLM